MTPLIKWFGSKFKLSQYLPKPLDGLPIIEAFAGSAGYSTRYGAGKCVHLADSNPYVFDIWGALIDGLTVDEVIQIPADTVMRKYRYNEHTSTIGVRHSSSVQLGIHGGKRFSEFGLAKQQELLWRFWCYSKPNSASFKRDVIPKHGGYFTKLVQSNIVNALENKLISGWTITRDYRDLPDIEATWIIDPPYSMTPKLNKCYGDYPKINYKELADWCLSRKGLVIVHDLEGANWLPFEKLRTCKTALINGKTKESNEVVFVRKGNRKCG